MLFEIFINSKGEIRDTFKISRFNEVFDLQKYPEFEPSFLFISEILSKYQSRFHLIPGKQRNVSIDIQTEENDKGEHKINAVFFGGYNILRYDDDFSFYDDGDEISYEGIRKTQLEMRLSEEALIPAHKLLINYDFEFDARTRFLYPYGYTVEK